MENIIRNIVMIVAKNWASLLVGHKINVKLCGWLQNEPKLIPVFQPDLDDYFIKMYFAPYSTVLISLNFSVHII